MLHVSILATFGTRGGNCRYRLSHGNHRIWVLTDVSPSLAIANIPSNLTLAVRFALLRRGLQRGEPHLRRDSAACPIPRSLALRPPFLLESDDHPVLAILPTHTKRPPWLANVYQFLAQATPLSDYQRSGSCQELVL